MNECSLIYELIQKEMDGDLTSPEIELINKHCQNCAQCQKIRNDYLQIEELLSSAPLLDPGPNFYSALVNKLEDSPQVMKDFHLSKLTGLIATITILLSAVMLFISWLILLPITGSLLYIVNNIWPIPYLTNVFGFISNFIGVCFNFINIIAQNLNPLLMLMIMVLSFISLIILVKIMLKPGRIIKYE
ncbi:MAG: hypothetical protein GX923_06825 [Clostridia bacterium]|jgi:hypothetical protein|nr:hypothetical protein [Clostridia bacterium]